MQSMGDSKMLEWIGLNTEKIAAGVMGLISLMGAAWVWLRNNRTASAKSHADVAIAESQAEVYSQMRERMTDLSAQVERLSKQVDELRDIVRDRDHRVHSLELYVSDLQHVLHSHGIDVPKMRA